MECLLCQSAIDTVGHHYPFLQLLFNISYAIVLPGRTSPFAPCYGALCSPHDSCDYQLTVTCKEAKTTPENCSTTRLGFVRLIRWGCIRISVITFKRLYNQFRNLLMGTCASSQEVISFPQSSFALSVYFK